MPKWRRFPRGFRPLAARLIPSHSLPTPYRHPADRAALSAVCSQARRRCAQSLARPGATCSAERRPGLHPRWSAERWPARRPSHRGSPRGFRPLAARLIPSHSLPTPYRHPADRAALSAVCSQARRRCAQSLARPGATCSAERRPGLHPRWSAERWPARRPSHRGSPRGFRPLAARLIPSHSLPTPYRHPADRAALSAVCSQPRWRCAQTPSSTVITPARHATLADCGQTRFPLSPWGERTGIAHSTARG
jgi:hypothetical protein